ncbi:hypothetical protein J4G07_00565 [Candidatus Poribacteria bacterium]|nr:hypothetical protein [Candidatus Poribacteria bacterium]
MKSRDQDFTLTILEFEDYCCVTPKMMDVGSHKGLPLQENPFNPTYNTIKLNLTQHYVG